MTVRELKDRIDAMVRDNPRYLDLEVCGRNDEFQQWDGMDPVEDVNIIRYAPTGSRFLGIGMKPYHDDYYHVAWPEDDHGSD